MIYTDLYSNVPGIKFVSAIARSAPSSPPSEVSNAIAQFHYGYYDNLFYLALFQYDMLTIQSLSNNQADHEDSRARRGHSCCCCTESSPGGGKGLA